MTDLGERVAVTESQIVSLESLFKNHHADIKKDLEITQQVLREDLRELKEILKPDHDEIIRHKQNLSVINKAVALLSAGVVSLVVAVAKGALGF